MDIMNKAPKESIFSCIYNRCRTYREALSHQPCRHYYPCSNLNYVPKSQSKILELQGKFWKLKSRILKQKSIFCLSYLNKKKKNNCDWLIQDFLNIELTVDKVKSRKSKYPLAYCRDT